MDKKLHDLKRLVQVHLGISEVDESDRLIEDLEAESIDVVNLVVDIEHEFGVLIDDDDMAGVSTVRDLWEVVMRSAAGPAA